MKSITFFFRHPQPNYFSMEKLFHAVAERLKNQPETLFEVIEKKLPFTSSISTIRKNISFVQQSQTGINHITGDAQYAILGCSKRNVNVLTVHDCVLLFHYPKYNPRYWIIKWLWYQLPVKRADAITVISEKTKKDLIFFTNCCPDKIHVIPNFCDPAFVARPKVFSKDYVKLLFIGTAPNKNLDRVVDAVCGLQVELMIVGCISELQRIKLDKKSIRYRILSKLTDVQMMDMYIEADVMLFPSTYEGFGLPIIEAQATGRVVITSQLEPMLSVAGNAACFVDPYSVDSIRSGIQKIIESESYRNELIQKGFRNIERFQLEKVKKQYSDLYKQLEIAKGN